MLTTLANAPVFCARVRAFLNPFTISCRLLRGCVLVLSCLLLITLNATGQVAVTVNPTVANLPVSGTLQFAATVTGTTNTAVTWSILEGAPGGTVDATGLYTAPAFPGSFHVIATSQADASQSATAGAIVPGFLVTGLRLQRYSHTATVLQDGRVFFAGGIGIGGTTPIASAEIYDPSSDSSTLTSSMTIPRLAHTAALLGNGQVLIAGGSSVAAGGYATTSAAELYDPVSGTFTATGSMGSPRQYFTATTLPNGQVLVAGGTSCNISCSTWATAELYDPVSGTFSATGSMATTRAYHTATLLPNGLVLIAGGEDSSNQGLASTELYDPSKGTFAVGPPMSTARAFFSATSLSDGRVLFAAGLNVQTAVSLASADIYDSATNSISPTAGNLNVPRNYHTGTLLGNGHVLIAGGVNGQGLVTSAELFDPTSGTFALAASLNDPRYMPTATLLGNGKVLIAGGVDNYSVLGSTELYDPTTGIFTTKSLLLNVPRSGNTQTVLPGGTILVAGGIYSGSCGPCAPYTSAEVFDPATGKFAFTGNMGSGRYAHTATLLNSGKVLVVGGWGGWSAQNGPGPALGSVELYDPVAGTFSPTGSLFTPRANHAASLLQNGQVLITGGQGAGGDLSSAEIYDPVSGTFSSNGNMTSTRYWHTSTLLNTGQVLIVGGAETTTPKITFLPTAELFDPSTGSFAATTSSPWPPTSTTPPGHHTATLLASGRVLIGNGMYDSEYYDPTTGGFSGAGNLQNETLARTMHVAALLPNGQVILAGGIDSLGATSDIYDPISNTFASGDNMQTPRACATATPLPNGNIMIVGGGSSCDPGGTRSVDIYQAPYPEPLPALTSVTPSTLTGFNPVTISIQGSGFLPNAVATIDAIPLATTYISSTELTAVVPASEMTQTHNHYIAVSNLGGSFTPPYTILIQNAVFTLAPQSSALDFGSINVGSTSPVQSVTISAGGNAPLVLGQISLTGTNPADFLINNTSTCPISGGPVQPGTSCTIDLLLAPKDAGALSAQASIPNNSIPSPAAVALVGTGIASPEGSLSATTLSFGNQQVGTSSSSQSVTLTNTGDLLLVLNTITLTNTSDFSSTNNCPASLAATASCTINVVFKPSAAGYLATLINFNDNAPGSPQGVFVSGTGTDVSLGSGSGGSTSQTIASGQSATFNLQASSLSGFNGTLTLSINCSSVPSSTCSVSPGSINVGPTAPTPFTVSVATTTYKAGAIPILPSQQPKPWTSSGYLLSRMCPLMFTALLVTLTRQFCRKRNLRAWALTSAAVILYLLLLSGCGSGGGGGIPQGTPPGDYTVAVAGSSQGVSRTLNLTLIVQ